MVAVLSCHELSRPLPISLCNLHVVINDIDLKVQMSMFGILRSTVYGLRPVLSLFSGILLTIADNQSPLIPTSSIKQSTSLIRSLAVVLNELLIACTLDFMSNNIVNCIRDRESSHLEIGYHSSISRRRIVYFQSPDNSTES